jgi:hypothetical protein
VRSISISEETWQCERLNMTNTKRALVLAGGGVVGTAWMAGLASGLRREGLDLAEADVIVGTSAGSIVGTMLATGQDLDASAGPAAPAGQGGGQRDSAPEPESNRMTEMFSMLRDTSWNRRLPEPSVCRIDRGPAGISWRSAWGSTCIEGARRELSRGSASTVRASW